MSSVSPRRPQLSRRALFVRYVAAFAIAAVLAVCALSAKPTARDDRKTAAALDVACQTAVKRNDADAMAKMPAQNCGSATSISARPTAGHMSSASPRCDCRMNQPSNSRSLASALLHFHPFPALSLCLIR
jgi:hypothetical protein